MGVIFLPVANSRMRERIWWLSSFHYERKIFKIKTPTISLWFEVCQNRNMGKIIMYAQKQDNLMLVISGAGEMIV